MRVPIKWIPQDTQIPKHRKNHGKFLAKIVINFSIMKFSCKKANAKF